MEPVIAIFSIVLTFQILSLIIYTLFTLWASKRPSGIAKNNKLHCEIAVIIPCYNEESTIEKKLANVVKSSSFTNHIKIYVLDDGSTDNTFKIAEKYRVDQNLSNLYVWKNPGKNGKARVLNWVFTQLKEDIVVATDADTLLEEDSILNLVANFSDPKIGAVTGKPVVQNKGGSKEGNFTQKEEGLFRKIIDIWRQAESNLDSCTLYYGQLLAFRLKLSSQFKIDENTYSDDTDLAFKIRRLGYRAVYERKAIFYEFVSESTSSRIKQETRRARGITWVLIRNVGLIGKLGWFGKVIFPFSFYNYVVSPLLTVFLLILLPIVLLNYEILLILFLLLFIPSLRIAAFGFISREIALVIGLLTPGKGRWKPDRA